MKPTEPRRARGWKLGTNILLATVLAAAGMLVTAKPADAVDFLSTSIYNNSPTYLGIVTTLGEGYSYKMLPYRWTPRNAKGGYTGMGWCTNVYYDMGDGRWQYRFQIKGPRYWSVAYAYIASARADSWQCY